MMHRVMGIDIETYSSVDLTDAGVYAYTEAPDFDILLISYIFDDWGEDDVRTIDCFDADPDMMAEFVEALTDPRIVKTAFNANFERTCLAKWLNKPMPPEEWRCTMVKALTLGLPGNLAGAGEALGLPAEKLKDPQGKALIQFFSKPCKPTRVNGQRTRNLPEHDPAKWQLYKNYNRQDVVTEQEILRKLSIYKTPEDEQALWSLDQHMNDNGVKLDIPMVEKIVAYDNQRRQELQEEAQELTGLKNPNSLAQLKRWLAEQGVEMDSVTKDTIAEALKQPDLPENVRRVLEIRTALGKTSVAKYSTMLVAQCQDHRLRGILQFYGANRSGRWAGPPGADAQPGQEHAAGSGSGPRAGGRGRLRHHGHPVRRDGLRLLRADPDGLHPLRRAPLRRLRLLRHRGPCPGVDRWRGVGPGRLPQWQGHLLRDRLHDVPRPGREARRQQSPPPEGQGGRAGLRLPGRRRRHEAYGQRRHHPGGRAPERRGSVAPGQPPES